MDDSPGKRLRFFRKKCAQTQVEFAKSLGFSQGMIAFLEKDEKTPSRNFLDKISRRYHVNSDWLLYGRGDMQHDPEPGFQPEDPSSLCAKPAQHKKPLQGDFVTGDEEYSVIKCYDIAPQGAPTPLVIKEDTAGNVAFTRSWLLSREISANLAGLVPAKGLGSGVVVPHWATMLVSFDVKHPLKQGFYLYRMAGELHLNDLRVLDYDHAMRIKRVLVSHFDQRGSSQIHEMTDDTDFTIVGRVVSIVSDISF